MNFFKRFIQRRNRKKIENYCSNLGHLMGWSIVGAEVQKFYELDLEHMLFTLETIILRMKTQESRIRVLLTNWVNEHGLLPKPNKTQVTLLTSDSHARILVTETTDLGYIRKMKMLYHGVGWMVSKEDDELEFSQDAIGQFESKLTLTRKATMEQRTSFVRSLNYCLCTLNDLERIINHNELKWEEKRG